MHPLQLGALATQSPGSRSRRQEQLVEAERLSVPTNDLAGRPVDSLDVVPKLHLDSQLHEALLRPQLTRAGFQLAKQHLLRQGRTFVGKMAFIADHPHRTGEP
ncbi:hypothetical protein D3C72_2157620 [compost metagenome]